MTRHSQFADPPLLSGSLLAGGLFAALRGLGLARRVAPKVFALTLANKRKARVFAGYQPTERDVFVTTYTKSGTNLALQIATQTAWRGAAEFNHIHELVAWPEAKLAGIVPLWQRDVWEQAPTGMRVIKTAAPAQYVPYSERARYITVLRDPKEVFVSGYHFFMSVFELKAHISVDDWLACFLAPGSLGSWWSEHTASFWRWRDRPNVLVMPFAKMKENGPYAVDAISSLMQVRLDEEQRAEVLRRSAFAYMKRHDWQFGPPKIPFTQRRAVMVRRGNSGGSGELLNREQQAAIDRHCQAELQRLGSDFPYAEMFSLS